MAGKDISNRQLLEAIEERLKAFATKEYFDKRLEAFATKDDLKAFATKDDLKAFATKDDLERAITRLERKVDANQRVNIGHHLETKAAIGKLNGDLTQLREGLARASGLA
ncbi:MAG: hypothetical protein ACREJM_04080 [Candidatus Saccharimonadales bacterium]